MAAAAGKRKQELVLLRRPKPPAHAGRRRGSAPALQSQPSSLVAADIARYLTRLLIRQDLTLRSARNLLVWLNKRSDVLSLPLPPALVEALGGYMA